MAACTPFVQNGFSISPLGRNSIFGALGAAAALSGKVMVFIELNGGNDGLNTLVPLDQYGKLANHRGSLLIPANKVLALSGTDTTGLHPAMTHFREMYDNGLVSIVQNVGYPQQDYSHFRSMDIWQTASDSSQFFDTGWLGRMLQDEHPGFPQGYPNPDNPDPLAIQIGSIVPVAFMGNSFPMGMSISSPDSFYEFINDYVEPAPATPYGDELEYIRLVQQQSQQYYSAIKDAAEKQPANLSTKYPPEYENYLADQLRIVARLIGGGLGTPVYMVSIGGFDTHSMQIDQPGAPEEGLHANLLRMLSEAVNAFQDDLRLMGKDDDVAGMTFSEFGRTIRANASMGTDHGAAAPLFVFGKNVNPGIIGSNPNIPQHLAGPGDVPMSHDFRQVYASVLQDWFGIPDPSGVLFGDYPILPIFKGTTPARELANSNTSGIGNYPNPVHDTTTITFTSLGNARITVSLLDTQGRPVAKIAEGNYPAGSHQVRFNRGSLPSGAYFYQVNINGIGVTKKMLLL